MPKRLTQEEFIERARAVHGNLYNYDKVVYKNDSTPVIITCPKHGDFTMCAGNHFRGGYCPKCHIDEKRGLVYGIGVNDTYSTGDPCYDIWSKMLQRCYDKKYQAKHPSYIGCLVAPIWHTFSNYLKWYRENQVEGWQVDKDVLQQGNRVYSPDTCCFLPRELNSLFTCERKNKYGRGVQFISRRNKFRVHITLGCKVKRIGYFDSAEEASQVYLELKEAYVRDYATNLYKEGKITERVYLALLRYDFAKMNDGVTL